MDAHSEFVFYRTYARWLEQEKRRETFPEAVERYVSFLERQPKSNLVPKKVFRKIRQYMLSMDVVGSMRLFWTAGAAAEASNVCGFNCSGICISSPEDFAELVYVLMCGCGVGFSVEDRYISQLPTVPIYEFGTPVESITIPDSKEGWAESIRQLITNLYNGVDTEFNYSLLRPRGAILKTMGGTSSGPLPLSQSHAFIKDIFREAQGRKLADLEVHDICCQLAEMVIVGGVRRAACISISDLDSEEMRHAKEGFNFPMRRYMANNSWLARSKPDASTFIKEWGALIASGSGERGIVNFTGLPESIMITNPCGEVLLNTQQFCNLSESVVRPHDDIESLLKKVETATWIGILQGTLTNFPYLRPIWKDHTEADNLLGVSLTGQMDNPGVLSVDNLKALKAKVRRTANRAAKTLGVNSPTRITCGKPSGCRPASALVTTAEGVFTLSDLLEKYHTSQGDWCEEVAKAKLRTSADGIITKTYINGVSPIKRITLNYGQVLESTPNHQWFILGQGWKRADEIVEGDIVQLDLSTYDKPDNCKFLSLNHRAINARYDSFACVQPEEVNEDIAWLLGYLWGDGAMSPGKYRLRWCDERKENIDKAADILLRCFGLRGSLCLPTDKKQAYELCVSSKLFWHWLIKNGVWKYFADNIDFIPLIIRCSSRNSIIAFLSGLFDADGCYSVKECKATLTMASYEFAHHVQDVASAVGLYFGVGHNVHGQNFQNEKSMYLLGLNNASSPSSVAVFQKHSNKLSSVKLREGAPKLLLGKVKYVQDGEPVETYDIETTNHEFLAGAARSHNTVSQLMHCGSGCHTWWDKFMIRRYRVSADSPITALLKYHNVPLIPENGQEHSENPTIYVVEFPLAAPEGAITRHQTTAIQQLEWYKHIQTNWCDHNQSCTIYVKEDEWMEVGAWVYKNWDIVRGVSFLPDLGGNYKLAPIESITEEEYLLRKANFPVIDYSKLHLFEYTDKTEGAKTFACVGDKCNL